jgi:hypothetical protein
MQDWNYLYTYSDFEITLELSYQKWPPASSLDSYWTQNSASLLAYMRKVHQGVRGIVINSSGQSVPATILVQGIDHAVVTSPGGWYFRPLAPGEYHITCSAPGYVSAQATVTITAYSSISQNFVLHTL